MGYLSSYKGWEFYNPTTQKYLISERAEFDERIFPGVAKYKVTSPADLPPPGSPSLAPVPTSVPMLDLEGDSDIEVIAPRIPHAELPLDAALPERTPTPPASPAIVHAPLPALAHDPPPDLRRTSRISRPPGEWWKVRHSAEPKAEPPVIWSEDEDGEQANSASLPEPRTFKQAMHGDQADGWREAATLEYNTLVETGTFEIMDLFTDQKAIGSGWVFQVKQNADGSIERLKARIVTKGYSQRPGLDYNESFAPTFHPATLRIIMAMAAVEDLELRSVHITSAFTNGDLDDEIYMNQPEGFHIGGPNKVCRLRKSLYGLKQSAECGRMEGRRKAFIVVESWTLRVSLCDDSGLEALNRTICIVFDPEYPSRSYGFLVRRQVHNFEGASLHKSVVLKCCGFSPFICLVAMHSLFEGSRFWQ